MSKRSLKLTDPQIDELARAFRDARIDQKLLFSVIKYMDFYGNFPSVDYDVSQSPIVAIRNALEHANQYNEVAKVITGLVTCAPIKNKMLLALTASLVFAEDEAPPDVDLGHLSGLEVMRTDESFERPYTFAKDLLKAMRKICTVVTSDGSRGTGFLIEPDLVLTAAHVINTARVVTCTFDFIDDHVPISVPNCHVDRIDGGEGSLDYATIKIPEKSIKETQNRGYVDLSTAKWPNDDAKVILLQHPGNARRGAQERLRMQMGQVTKVDVTEVNYTSDTRSGSSGSPIFDLDFAPIGIHRGRVKTQRVNTGTLLDAIFQEIQKAPTPLPYPTAPPSSDGPDTLKAGTPPAPSPAPPKAEAASRSQRQGGAQHRPRERSSLIILALAVVVVGTALAYVIADQIYGRTGWSRPQSCGAAAAGTALLLVILHVALAARDRRRARARRQMGGFAHSSTSARIVFNAPIAGGAAAVLSVALAAFLYFWRPATSGFSLALEEITIEDEKGRSVPHQLKDETATVALPTDGGRELRVTPKMRAVASELSFLWTVPPPPVDMLKDRKSSYAKLNVSNVKGALSVWVEVTATTRRLFDRRTRSITLCVELQSKEAK